MFDKIVKYFSSKSPKEIIIVILVIIVLLWLVKKYVFPSIGDVIKKITPPKPNDGSTASNILPARDAYLRDLATELYTAYSCLFCSNQPSIEAISKALALNDSELIILNKYYHEQGENTLYYDTDWEFMPNTEVDDALLAKLEELNISLK